MKENFLVLEKMEHFTLKMRIIKKYLFDHYFSVAQIEHNLNHVLFNFQTVQKVLIKKNIYLVFQ